MSRRVYWQVPLLLAAAYALLCAAVYLMQARLLYFPYAPLDGDPSDVGLAFRDLRLETVDGETIHAWHVSPELPRGTILVCHGNAGNISHRMDLARTFGSFGWSTLLFDYRGYGQSTGSPDEEGTYRDAQRALAYLEEELGLSPHQIALFGESLGAAVATDLAVRSPVGAVILESGFASLPELAAELYPWLPARRLARFQYDSRSKIGRLGAPLLLIHSPDDEVVPYAHAKRLLEAANEPKHLLTTTGGHNDGGFRLRPEWRAQVETFLNQPPLEETSTPR